MAKVAGAGPPRARDTQASADGADGQSSWRWAAKGAGTRLRAG